jgi:hypothetical protein
MYADEIEKSNKSVDPLINNGISEIFMLYVTHNDDDTIFMIQNNNEYEFVDFLVYNKYMKMNLPEIEITVAEYAVINSFLIFIYNYKIIFTNYTN